MSKKAIIGTIIVIVVIGVGVWLHSNSRSDSMENETIGSPSAMKTPTTTTPGNLATSNKDTSDAAITQDMSSIDAQMNGLNSDNASADQGLSNQNK